MGKGNRNRNRRREELERGQSSTFTSSPTPIGRISCDNGECIQVGLIPRNILTAIVPLTLRDQQGVKPLGTAFSVGHFPSGHSVFVTAKHVVDCNLPPQPGVDILAIMPVSPEHDQAPLQLTGARTVQMSLAEEFCDVALLVVDRRTAPLQVFADLRNMPLTFGRPQVGGKCLALGYSDMAIGKLTEDAGPWDFKLRASQGVIEELHPTKRDASMVNFPSFRTNAYYEHGMSGGPLVNENGRVIGVVSSSYDQAHATAYAAAVAAIGELSIDLEDQRGNVATWPMKQLAEDGILNLDRGQVTLARDNSGLVLTWAEEK
jgi:hypothetical protein